MPYTPFPPPFPAHEGSVNGAVPRADGSEGGPAAKARPWILLAVLVVALGSIGLFVFWPEPSLPPGDEGQDLRSALASSLPSLESDSLLFINIPPAGARYPGSILLAAGNVPLELARAEEGGFTAGQPASARTRLRAGSSASLGVGVGLDGTGWLQSALDVLAGREGDAEVSLSFEGRTVESDGLLERIGASRVAERLTEEGIDAYVIFRAWRGTLALTVQRRSGADLQVLDSISSELQELAGRAGGGVSFSGSLDQDRESEFRLVDDDVFAYEGYAVAPLYRLAAGIAEDDPVVGGEAAIRPVGPAPAANLDTVVSQIIRLDPEILPRDAFPGSLELGPEVTDAVLRVMREGDTEERERGLSLLRKLPRDVLPDAPAEGVRDADPAVRAVSILEMAETRGGTWTRDVARALDDDDPVVRYVASEALVSADSPEAREALVSAGRADDPAVRAALSTARFQLARDAGAVTTAEVFQAGDPQLELGAVLQARSPQIDTRDKLEVLSAGLESNDSAVVKESLLGLGRLEGAAAPAAAAVRELTRHPDPEVRKLATRTLRRIRPR